jgi:hypothetical protein
MLFEMSLSQAVLVNLLARRFSPLEELCFALPSEPPYFDRIDLHGAPTFVAVPEARTINLADGTSVYLFGVRLKVTQHFNVFAAIPTFDSLGATTGLTSLGPFDAWLDLSLRLEVLNGNANMCIEFESLTLPPGLSSDQTKQATDAATSFIQKSCTPVPIADLLNQLTANLPSSGSVFQSTEVLNAGIALGPGTGALLIRIEVDAIDPDAQQIWTAFFQGADSPVIGSVVDQPDAAPTLVDWMVTIDRRLFTRIVSAVIADVEAGSSHDGQPGHLDLSMPSVKWHPSQDLWGVDSSKFPPIPKKLGDGLPTLSASIDGTAVDVCGGVFGATDIDFTADVTLAFAVPAQDTWRLYVGMTTDASDWDLFKCGLNLTATISLPLIPVIGPFGIAVGAFLAIVILSLNGGTAGNFAFDKKCHQEYGLEVCDYPWSTASPMGTLHLTSVMGFPFGLAFLGSMFTLPPAPSNVLSWKAAPKFAWHPVSCASIEEEGVVRAEAWVETTGADICDARILNDPDAAYSKVIKPGAKHISLVCTKPKSSLPQYSCRVLVATSRGLFLAIIAPPPSEISIGALKMEQQIMCMDFMTAIDTSTYIDWITWPSSPVESEPIEIIPVDLALVVIDVTIAGLGAGQVAHVKAGGQVIAAGMPGPLGFASVGGVLDAQSVSAQLSVASAGRRHTAPVTRPAIDANLEFWRSAGTMSVLGTIRDLIQADAESCWLATTHGILRMGVRSDPPALLEHFPAHEIHRLALTEYGLFAGGTNGLGILDRARGEVRTLHDIGPVYALARRASNLYVAGRDAIHTFHLGWTQDSRGRRRSPAVRQMNVLNAHDIRSAMFAGRFLVVASDDAIHVHEMQRDGSVGPGRSIPLLGLRQIHPAVGADTHETIVAIFKDRAVLMRLDSFTHAGQHKMETLHLPRLPWFVGSRRMKDWLVRQKPKESVVDVFKLLQRVDLVRREARLRSRLMSAS